MDWNRQDFSSQKYSSAPRLAYRLSERGVSPDDSCLSNHAAIVQKGPNPSLHLREEKTGHSVYYAFPLR